MTRVDRLLRGKGKSLAVAAVFVAGGLYSRAAGAQQKTFHLDRLEIPGGPDDGLTLFRPVTQQRSIFYAQMGLGYSLRPLHTENITADRGTLSRSPTGVVQDQFTLYGSTGFQIADRFTLGATFPMTLIQDGQNPLYGPPGITGTGINRTTQVDTGGPALGDFRIDFRGVLWRSADRRSAFGAQLSVFAPTGNSSSTNFGGDGQTTAMLLVTGETTIKFITLVANTGVHFRPENSINDPSANSGLGIGNEWRWAVGAFVPLKDGKFRIGGSIFGQTGIESGPITGDTLFTKRNTPVEWNAEGRMRLGPGDKWWVGGGAGTRILNGYGAPDLRVVLLAGMYVPILDSNATSPEAKAARRDKWREEHSTDSDHDGIPDDLDACPNEPEDHLGNDPSDGCPTVPDRDGDGIPDSADACPDVPGVGSNDPKKNGCPGDTDADGILDAQDACPKNAGPPNPDPKKNGCPLISMEGTMVRVLEQVHFAFGSATILPDSFPMLQEIANLLKSNAAIKRMSIEGHTDNKGDADLNKRLSQGRANSVMAWLVQHGVLSSRLEAHGYGMEKPIQDNATDKGRAANRRVEFKILEEQ